MNSVHFPRPLAACLLATALIACSDGGGGGSGGSTEPAWVDDSDCRGGNASVTLRWTPPDLLADGTPIPNISGYKLYFGLEGWGLTRMLRLPGGISEYTLDGLRDGNCEFALTAVGADGVEGAFSESVLVEVVQPE